MIGIAIQIFGVGMMLLAIWIKLVNIHDELKKGTPMTHPSDQPVEGMRWSDVGSIKSHKPEPRTVETANACGTGCCTVCTLPLAHPIHQGY